MHDFEIAYKNWITAIANYSINQTDTTVREDLQKANDVLVNLVFHLHSEYPVATLHDCNESINENPVVLGKTILGSFKN